MSLVIYKYSLPKYPAEYHVSFPDGARLLRAGPDAFGDPVLWALVDPMGIHRMRRILAAWTGIQFDPAIDMSKAVLLGAIVSPAEGLVTHYFDLGWLADA